MLQNCEMQKKKSNGNVYLPHKTNTKINFKKYVFCQIMGKGNLKFKLWER